MPDPDDAVETGGTHAKDPRAKDAKGSTNGKKKDGTHSAAQTVPTSEDSPAPAAPTPEAPPAGDDYTLPLLHTRLPRAVVNVGFWAGLGGAAVIGVLDPPVALAVGAGVVIARHAGGGSGRVEEPPPAGRTEADVEAA